MKLKILATVGLGTLLLLGGCKGNAGNTNTGTLNTNTNTAMATATPTPIVQTGESATTDTVLKTQIENALKAKGFTSVTVDTSTTPATLRGTYPKGKLAEVVQTAQQSAGKPLQNQMAEAK
jgi:RNA-binding protein YhbY